MLWLEFKLIYFEAAVDQFSHSATHSNIIKVSKVDDHSWGWPEGSLFDGYYTKL